MLLKSGARVGTTIIQDNFYRMDNIEKAKNRLIHFIKEMSAWEIACEEIDEQDIEEIEKLRQQKELLTDIFRKHCTAKKRVYGKCPKHQLLRFLCLVHFLLLCCYFASICQLESKIP